MSRQSPAPSTSLSRSASQPELLCAHSPCMLINVLSLSRWPQYASCFVPTVRTLDLRLRSQDRRIAPTSPSAPRELFSRVSFMRVVFTASACCTTFAPRVWSRGALCASSKHGACVHVIMRPHYRRIFPAHLESTSPNLSCASEIPSMRRSSSGDFRRTGALLHARHVDRE